DLSQEYQAAFIIGTIAFIAKMTAADGDSTFDEVRVFRQIFRITGDNLDDVSRVFNEAKKSSFGYEDYANELVEIFGTKHETLDALLDGLFAIAYADHVLTGAELEFLRDISLIFGLSKVEFDQLCALHDAQKTRNPYMVLGVRRTMATVQIEDEYQRQMARYSPGELTTQGMPNSFGELAAMRMQLLTEAMERILTEREVSGMSNGETPQAYFKGLIDLTPIGIDFEGIDLVQDPRYADEEEREAWRKRNEKRR
ncbi:MAG: TerB family tellurite resistance protein, partial [Pseudomonadota bacterium]